MVLRPVLNMPSYSLQSITPIPQWLSWTPWLGFVPKKGFILHAVHEVCPYACKRHRMLTKQHVSGA